MKGATLYAVLISAALLVGLAMAGSNSMNASADTAAKADIVDTAIAAGSFNTLVSAVQAAELVDTLKGDGPFTVFAPTDEAFAKIPADQIEALLANKTQLTEVLTYHVVAGEAMSSDLENGMMVETLQGGNLSINTTEGVMVNDAKVMQADITCTNGVIHVIDTVLLP